MSYKDFRGITADGVRVAVVTKLQKKQTEAYFLGKTHSPFDPKFAREVCTMYSWTSLAWDIKSRSNPVPGTIYILCPVKDLDEDSNEFGLVSP